jgi:hypothetical protein
VGRRKKLRSFARFTTLGATGNQRVNIKDHPFQELPFQDEWVDIPGCDISRWVLAHEYKLGLGRLIPNNPVCDRTTNFPPPGDFQDDWLLYLGFCLLGLIYGGLHCAAWNAPFTTDVEALLWRISSVAAASAGILLPILWELSSENGHTIAFGKPFGWVYDWGLAKLHIFYDNTPKSGPESRLLTLLRSIDFSVAIFFFCGCILVAFVRWAFLFGFILLYCVARVYLVVECFINLAHLPDSAFQVPQWSQYVPHIS